MSDGEPRRRPDGSAWREAQKSVAARNDEARKRGREERTEADKRDAVNRAAAERRGVER
jgi:hypothetical protein